MQLRNEIAETLKLLVPANGTVVPSLEGVDWIGIKHTIVYGQDQRPTLVYTFSQGCKSCQENWRALRWLQVLAPKQLRTVYIDTLGDRFTPEYIAANGIGQSPLLVQLSPAAKYAYQARLTPQLVLVNYSGQVQWSHAGELSSDDISEALSLVGHN